MKDYLIETFRYNDITNIKLLEKISLLNNNTEAIKLFSHLVNCQYKWMARILHNPGAKDRSWWEPVYCLEQLEAEWAKSLKLWIDYIAERTDEELCTEVTFIGADGGCGPQHHRILHCS